MIRGFSGVAPLVWQRLAASWRLLSVLAFGILIAATLMAVSPVYTRVMNDLGLDSALEEQIGSASRNGFVRFDLPLGAPESASAMRELAGITSDEISWFTGSEVRFGALPSLQVAREPGSPPLPAGTEATRLEFATLTGLEDRVRFTEGRSAKATDTPAGLEAVVSREAALFLGLKVGDRLLAAFSFDDCNRPPPTQDPEEIRARARFACVPQTFVQKQIRATVVGIYERQDPEGAYWGTSPVRSGLITPSDPDPGPPVVFVLLPEESFYKALPQVVPGLRSEFRLYSLADVTRLNSANLDRARDSLTRVRDRLQDKGAIPDLAMAGPLASFKSRASFNQIPLLLLLIQVVGIALYYVLLVSSLLSERRAEEIAMLRSRGASVGQIVALAAAEAAVLALGAALIAPFLASAAVAALGKTGTFDAVSHGHFLAYTVVPASFLFAAGGAALATFAVVIPAFFAARRGMVLFLRSAARPGKPLLQRYYIDVAVVGLAALALWELNQRGSVFDPRTIGGWSADPLLLLSPLLLITAIGAIMFRLLPAMLSLISRFVAATSGPGLTLGLWQLTRSPARYTQLALLVVMAAAVGTFAATYGQTTDRSQEERALYETGADVRLTGFGNLAQRSTPEVLEQLKAVPGVEAVATAYRTELSLGPLPSFGDRIPVLALDPMAAPSLLWFRDDFAAEDLTPLLRRVGGSPVGAGGLAVPGEPSGASVWVNPVTERVGSTLWLRTVDAAGVYRLHEFGTLDFEGWRRLETRFSPERENLRYPVTALGLIMTQAVSLNDASRNLLIDDLAAIDANGRETIIEDFEGGFRWDAIRTATRTQDTVARIGQGAHRGTGAAQYSFKTGTGTGIRGMYVSDPNIPLPAIASTRFLERTGLRAGGEVQLVLGNLLVPLSVQGETHLFPSMTDLDRGFLIVNQEHLYAYAGLTAQSTANAPNEAWLRLTKDPDDRARTLATFREKFGIPPSQTTDLQDVLKKVRQDPVVRAGGSGILLVALVAAFSILILGFALTLYLGGQARTVEVSVMRAVGLAPRQVLVMISLEYLLVASIGLAIGTIAGLRISDTMLSFLNVTEEGARVIPPFSLTTRWDTIALAFAATALAFLAGVGALAAYFLRVPVSRILRLTR